MTMNNKLNQHIQSSEKQPLVVDKLPTLSERQQQKQQQQYEWIAILSLLAVICIIVLFFVPG